MRDDEAAGAAGTGARDGAEPVAERAREGLEHLQAAARELIAAARAALDVAEDIVDDPSIVKTLTESRSPAPSGAPRPVTWLEGVTSLAGAFGPLGELIRNATSAGGYPAPGGRPDRGDGDDEGHGLAGRGGNGSTAEPTVERIVIR